MFSRLFLRRVSRLPENLLAIETSCDDTCCAIFNSQGQVISELVNSQILTSLAYFHTNFSLGGIVPSVAWRLHSESIKPVVQNCLDAAHLSMTQISAIAVTNRPGLKGSLSVGVEYSKLLSLRHSVPILPIHHMEAHALTARLCFPDLEFPYLCLLVSGGHMLLVHVKSPFDFYLLGKTMDESPGDVYDKIARELGLKSLPECGDIPGGAAIEKIALESDREMPIVEAYRNNSSCDFSLSGIHAHFDRVILQKRKMDGSMDYKDVTDIADCFQRSLLHHILRRVGRAILFCRLKGFLPESGGKLVVSGGVASNKFLLRGLSDYCQRNFEYNVLAPPARLCTDNAVMIGWNALERLRGGDCYCEVDSLMVYPRSPLGIDVRRDVAEERIKPPK